MKCTNISDVPKMCIYKFDLASNKTSDFQFTKQSINSTGPKTVVHTQYSTGLTVRSDTTLETEKSRLALRKIGFDSYRLMYSPLQLHEICDHWYGLSTLRDLCNMCNRRFKYLPNWTITRL